MSTPGIADPYWYEWFVGLKYIIKMLNPDNHIKSVTFQKEAYDTIDDVVIEYSDSSLEECFQVKHEIGTSSTINLTFGKLLEKGNSNHKSLIDAMSYGWYNATQEKKKIVPVLFTNRDYGRNKTQRTYMGNEYTAYPLNEFMEKLTCAVEKAKSYDSIHFDDPDMQIQWKELCAKVNLSNEKFFSFLKVFKIKTSMPTLMDFDNELKQDLRDNFSCSLECATSLYKNLIFALREWTTSCRNNEKVTIEDVYTVLALEDKQQDTYYFHSLLPPSPFFNSRDIFCKELIDNIKKDYYPIVFISGLPGSGKTSIASYIQFKYSLFTVRYHTFRPISPEQRFYDADDGLCSTRAFWGETLSQLRKIFSGHLNEYKVPLTNELCSDTQLRQEALRLLGEQHNRIGETVFVCIDGIDHAARSQKDVTFLSSLCQPNAVPFGVTFVIIGQPSEMYTKYPIWLKQENALVKHIPLPPIKVNDVEQLINEKLSGFIFNSKKISEVMHKKTQGNNLSLVFLVEQAKKCSNIDELNTLLVQDYISDDINNYYDHIWEHVSKYIQTQKLGISYPDAVIASVILLMNGRVNTEVLAGALNDLTLSLNDWDTLMDELYPLIEPVKNNSHKFMILHNDFRIYLMSKISDNNRKFQHIALELAEYYHSQKSSLEKVVNLFPLLISAKRNDLVVKWFDSTFVIEALGEGLSYQELYRYANMAYIACCENKNWDHYLQTYLAISSINQHRKYYEWQDKNYFPSDNYDLKTFNTIELTATPSLNKNSLDAYSIIINKCFKLLQSDISEYKERASSLYSSWFDQYKPNDFAPFIEGDKLTIDDQLFVIIDTWGKCAANLKKRKFFIKPNDSLPEKIAILKYNDAYFTQLFESQKYAESAKFAESGSLSKKCIEEKLDIIHENDMVDLFGDFIKNLTSSDDLSTKLLAIALLIHNGLVEYIIPSNNELGDGISNIYDETSFQAVLYGYILGNIEYLSDTAIILEHVNKYYRNVSSEDSSYDYLRKIVHCAALLGKCEKLSFKSLPINDRLKKEINDSIKWFLINYPRRSFDFTKAYRYILNECLNTRLHDNIIIYHDFVDSLENCLYSAGCLEMYFKTNILDFLISHGEDCIVRRFYLYLYGENGEKLTSYNSFSEMHSHFKENGVKVLPELMETVSNKLKWDCVNYTGHKEYVLNFSLDLYKIASSKNSKIWDTTGKLLLRISNTADIAGGNRVSEDIKDAICRTAIKDGISSFWTIHNYDNHIHYSEEYLYTQLFDFIDVASNIDELKAIWSYACGILSWYFKDDVLNLHGVYNACNQKCLQLIDDSFDHVLFELTPMYSQIVKDRDSVNNYQAKSISDYDAKKEKIVDLYKTFAIDKLINEVAAFTHLDRWYKLDALWNEFMSRNVITPEIIDLFKKSVFRCAENYSWVQFGCGKILKSVIDLSGGDCLWELAESITGYLFDYDASSSVDNMEFILKEHYNLMNSIEQLEWLNVIIENHQKWISGNGHFELPEVIDVIQPTVTSPKRLSELFLDILLEQIELNSACKLENAYVGIYLLSIVDSEIFRDIKINWHNYSRSQKSAIYKVAERWCHEILPNEIYWYDILESEYINSSDLSEKYQLFNILNIHNEILGTNRIKFEFSAASCDYTLSKIHTQLINKNIKFSARNFLYLTADFYDEEYNNDIIKYIKDNIADLEYKPEKYLRSGDSKLPLYDSDHVVSSILYGEEKNGRWNDIPLSYKMQWLLLLDDGYLMTVPPTIVNEIDIAHIEDQIGKVDNNTLLLPMIEYGLSDSQMLLGSCIWFPVGQKEGIIYKKYGELSKIEYINSASGNISKSFGNYCLLSEYHDVYSVETEQFSHGLSPLFHELVGTGSLTHGNCYIRPTALFNSHLQWNPQIINPLIWTNKNGEPCMYFERLIFPLRSSMQELYIRQPIVFRWVCYKKEFDVLLKKNREKIVYSTFTEKYPKFGA